MRKSKSARIAVKLGGSLLFKSDNAIDVAFLKSLKAVIDEFLAGGQRLLVVVGGGRTTRLYQAAARAAGVSDSQALDWLGIAATHLNAELIKALFIGQAQPTTLRLFEDKVDEKYPLVLGGGIEPGVSTDYDACYWAVKTGAPVVVRASNVAYVYERDPGQDPQAKPLEKLSWAEYKEMIGGVWTPGLSSPFDQVAAKYAAEHGLEVRFFNGADLTAFKNALWGRSFKGTIIS